MRFIVGLMAIVVCVGVCGCSSSSMSEHSEADIQDFGPSTSIDGVEVPISMIEGYMEATGLSAEEAERQVRESIAREREATQMRKEQGLE